MTSDEVNALPERVRRYIHDLETRCDPAGEVRELWAARENLAAMIELRSLAWDEGYEQGLADGFGGKEFVSLPHDPTPNPYRKGSP